MKRLGYACVVATLFATQGCSDSTEDPLVVDDAIAVDQGTDQGTDTTTSTDTGVTEDSSPDSAVGDTGDTNADAADASDSSAVDSASADATDDATETMADSASADASADASDASDASDAGAVVTPSGEVLVLRVGDEATAYPNSQAVPVILERRSLVDGSLVGTPIAMPTAQCRV